MKPLILFLTLIIFFTTNAYSKEAVDCKNLKKFSIKAAMCKTKNATNAFKDKLSKKRELKKEAKKNLVKNQSLKNLEKQKP